MDNKKEGNNYILCECGNKVFKTNISSHRKRPIHTRLIKEKEELENKDKNKLKFELLDILQKYGVQIKNEEI